MDISVLKAIYKELAKYLPGARVAALDEGESGELYLAFKGAEKTWRLLISPRPRMPRAHLTKKAPRSKELSPFAQSLKNSITGSILESVSQPGLERVLFFNLKRKVGSQDERCTLVFEMAGKKPNLILLDGDGRIILAQSYVSIGEEAVRPVLPGLAYEPPTAPQKLDPYSLTVADVEKVLQESAGMPPEKALYRKVGGISPLLAREAVARAGEASPEEVSDSLKALLKEVTEGPCSPRIYQTVKGPVLAAFVLRQFEGAPFTEYDSMSQAAEAFYMEAREKQELAGLKNALLKGLHAKLAAAKKKADAIKADLDRAEDAERYQLYGSVLMASPGKVEKGADAVTLPNLFSEGERLEIPLDTKLTPVQNAEAYFKKARKAKAGEAILRERLAAALKEAGRLEDELERAEAAETIEGLNELRAAPGREKGKAGPKIKGGLPDFPSFVSSDGYRVLYSKNAKMNDILTFKLAAPMDLWLHAQGYHGAHVIVQNPARRPDIPLQTILEAAQVAAYYSGAKKDSTAAVDYTLKKFIRKPKDPTPGQAIFTNNKTVFVKPKKPPI